MRNSTFGEVMAPQQPLVPEKIDELFPSKGNTQKRLLFLHTGGTFGMTGMDPGPLTPAHYTETVLPYVKGLETLAQIEVRVVCNIDSSDLGPPEWEQIGSIIHEEHDNFDGFVILHGTDTMAYTASALSFMLQGLQKPVVLTGSQRPIAHLRTDARRNLVHATICASMDVPEVGIYFGDHLFRGNRTTKTSVQSYEAFTSPNCPPLISMGVEMIRETVAPLKKQPFHFAPGFDRRVAVVSLAPGISPHSLKVMAIEGARAVVIRAFGMGNIPTIGWPDAIHTLCSNGVAVIIVSQCSQGSVIPGRYEGSTAAAEAGALFGAELTTEAAVTKSMWLIGQGISGESFKEQFMRPLAGEMNH